MGQPDLALNNLVRHADVFADVVNVFVYEGKQVVKAEDLRPYEEKESTASAKAKKGILKGLYRDVCKENIRNGTRYQIIGVENQWKVDYTMPFRIMGYDYARYVRQIEEIVRQNKEAKNPAIPGRIHPYQKLKPVITLVLYYGDEEDDEVMPRNIFEMLELPENDAIRQYIQNYRINVISLRDITPKQAESFRSDFRCIAKYMSRSYNDKQTEEAFQEEQSMLTHTKDILITMATISGDKRYLEIEEKEKGDVAMCAILDACEQRGMERGEAKGTIETLQELGITREDAITRVETKFSLPKDKVALEVDKYWK